MRRDAGLPAVQRLTLGDAFRPSNSTGTLWYMRDPDARERQILTVVGDEEDPAVGSQRWFAHLIASLQFPCEVIGKEDFRWEEPYILGIGSTQEYLRLCRTQPSFQDVYSLEGIEPDVDAGRWAMGSDDLGARVRRVDDGKEFVLGLSELTTLDVASAKLVRRRAAGALPRMLL